jgi:hypothetical protein
LSEFGLLLDRDTALLTAGQLSANHYGDEPRLP